MQFVWEYIMTKIHNEIHKPMFFYWVVYEAENWTITNKQFLIFDEVKCKVSDGIVADAADKKMALVHFGLCPCLSCIYSSLCKIGTSLMSRYNSRYVHSSCFCWSRKYNDRMKWSTQQSMWHSLFFFKCHFQSLRPQVPAIPSLVLICSLYGFLPILKPQT